MKVYVNYTVTREYSFIQQENEEKYLNILHSPRFPTAEEEEELEKLTHEAMAKAMIEDNEYERTDSVIVEDDEGERYAIYEW